MTDTNGMPLITATRVGAPPAWALLERNLIAQMEEAARLRFRQCTERGGAILYAEDFDDLFEQFYNWGLFYAMGADDSLLEMAATAWNATARISDESVVHRTRFNDHKKVFRPSARREFWNLQQAMEWHHLGEGMMAFYDFGVADPTISEMARRAQLFAGFYTGDDPEAPNYDPEHKVLRSPFQSSQGPLQEASAETAHAMLLAGRWLGSEVNYYGVRASLYPIVEDLELDWWEDPARQAEIVDLFNKLILQADTPNNLGAAALVTHAYLYTGDERYKRWVLEYTEAWMERAAKNGGLMPDNVGPTGVVGERRNGNFWGGQYGWNHYQGFNIMFHSLNIAAECALLLTGDYGYLDLLRDQVKVLLDASIKREDGQLIMPTRYGPSGWQYDPPLPRREDTIVPMRHVYTGPMPWRMQELTHLYHASMSQEDRELIERVREGEVERDWNCVGETGSEKNSGQTEFARYQYYDGKNPDWPEKILSAEAEWSMRAIDEMRKDGRTVIERLQANAIPANPVLTKGLTQVTMGAPQSIYNGGLLRATVRYYDRDEGRPGLPSDVAALVDHLAPDAVGVQLVNCSREHSRRLIVQAGAFGEHTFTEVRTENGEGEEPVTTAVNGKYVAVDLPPAAKVRLEAGLSRFSNDPSYAFPWHGDEIPIPFPVDPGESGRSGSAYVAPSG